MCLLVCIVTGLFIVPVVVLAVLGVNRNINLITLLLAGLVKTGIQASRQARPRYRPVQTESSLPPRGGDPVKELKQKYDDKIRVARTIADTEERSIAIA